MTYFIFFLNVIILLLLGGWIIKKQEPVDRILYGVGLGVKLLAGISLGIVYQDYYQSGDTFVFFDLAVAKAQLAGSDIQAYLKFLWQDTDLEWKGAARSLFFVKMISIFAFVTDGNYWAASMWLSFISFLGALYLVRIIIRLFPESKWPAAAAFFFFPSAIFWGSGIIKESLGLAGLLFLAGVFLKLMKDERPSWVEYIASAIAVWMLWKIKYYWISIFLPVSITSLIIHALGPLMRTNIQWKYTVWFMLFLTLCTGASLLHPNFHARRIFEVVVENNAAFVSNSGPTDLIHYNNLTPTWQGMIYNSPWALFSGMFRPFLWEADSLFKLIVAVENFLVLILAAGCFFRIRMLFNTENSLISLSVVVYTKVLCIFLALSTPNFGSLARYKVGFLSFILFLIIYKNPLLTKVQSWAGFNRSK